MDFLDGHSRDLIPFRREGVIRETQRTILHHIKSYKVKRDVSPMVDALEQVLDMTHYEFHI